MTDGIKDVKQSFTDERGIYVSLFKDKDKGEFFMITAHPGKVRGGHYHKKRKEIFYVIKGKAQIFLKDVETGKVEIVEVGDEEITGVEILPGFSHCVRNVGDEDMYMVAYTDSIVDPENPDEDEYPHKIEEAY